jgi:hypothetical protein
MDQRVLVPLVPDNADGDVILQAVIGQPCVLSEPDILVKYGHTVSHEQGL